VPAKPTAAPVSTGRMASPEYGAHVFLGYDDAATERDLQLAKDGGFQWVKQIFLWEALSPDEQGQMKPDVLAKYDKIVGQAQAKGLKLLVRVGSPPKWASKLRSTGANPPPDDLSETGPMANFLYGLASRYKGKIAAYQIWNEPNLKREWGKTPDAAEYDRLLKTAYHSIKAADPSATVISAGLSPTGVMPPEAVPDDMYLEQMYQAFANQSSNDYFDVLGAHGAGYKAPPETDPAQAEADKSLGGHRSFVFRRVEDLRKIMEKYGDSKKQVALLEFGWVIDGGAKLDPSYRWYAQTPQKQAEYIVNAYKWAKEHWSPWIGLMSVIYILSPGDKDTDEYYWWAITNPDGTPRPAYNAIKAWRAAGN
jgi:polysaccharide biosynthesis protein PslG